MYSILHISDLHRSPDEPADNDSLVAALLADRDRYIGETPNVPSPDAIVVSGDLIRGAAFGDPKWQDTIRAQYEVAGKFLDHVSRRLLAGDRRRLIIIPGNHDVCWNTSFNSMELVSETDYPRDLRKALLEPGSIYRWSWKERALYRIRDLSRYRQRLAAFWDFTERFYAGVTLFRPIDRNRGYQLFELNDRRIVLATFDSTCNNDCFGYATMLASKTIIDDGNERGFAALAAARNNLNTFHGEVNIAILGVNLVKFRPQDNAGYFGFHLHP